MAEANEMARAGQARFATAADLLKSLETTAGK
jgi:hypothetical protein